MTERKRKPEGENLGALEDDDEIAYTEREPEDDEIQSLWDYYSSCRRQDRIAYDMSLAALRRQVAFAKAGLSVEKDEDLVKNLKTDVARLDKAIRQHEAILDKLKPRKEALDKKKGDAAQALQIALPPSNGKSM